MMRLGAVGELTGWAFDAQGRIIDGGIKPPPDQHSPASPCRSPDHRGSRRSCQGRSDSGALKGTSDQRLDHRRGDGKRHPAASSKVKAIAALRPNPANATDVDFGTVFRPPLLPAIRCMPADLILDNIAARCEHNCKGVGICFNAGNREVTVKHVLGALLGAVTLLGSAPSDCTEQR